MRRTEAGEEIRAPRWRRGKTRRQEEQVSLEWAFLEHDDQLVGGWVISMAQMAAGRMYMEAR
jgi:hypothetical protein